MNTSIHKLLTLLSLLALVVMPMGTIASSVIYGEPITISEPTITAGSNFGSSVSISGDKVLIGAERYGTSAYLYDTTGTLLQTFDSPTPGYYFGNSVSISGDKVLIGAQNDYTGATKAGSAYLYDATTGDLLHTFNNPTPVKDGHFGNSVSISGDKVLIGASGNGAGYLTGSGSVYLYDATTGALLHTFNNPTPAPSDYFGRSVSISGDTVLIGAHGDDTGATRAGSAYLFDATTGDLLQTINNPTPAEHDYFGISVFISGDKALIGAPQGDTVVNTGGFAYLYDTATGALLQTFNNPTSTSGDHFGDSVSISDDKVLIGAYGDDTGAVNTGSAYLYDATTGDLLQTFNNPTSGEFDFFGDSVSISGDNILIGALFDDTGATSAGSAYLYLPQLDTDEDGIPDSADNCPANPNPDQTDTDGDGEGDPCDFTPNGDDDGDGVDNLLDNCQGVYNPGQEDNDGDGLGNVCDPTPDGDINLDPTDKDQCKDLGWTDFGFRNQGQCVAFVNTGNDNR